MQDDAQACVSAALAFGRANLVSLCVETLAWKQGNPPGTALSELARLCARCIGSPNSLDAATLIVSRLAMESITGRAAPTEEAGRG